MEAGLINWLVDYMLVFFSLLAIIAFSKWHEYSQEKKLRDLTGWTFTGGDGLPLFYEITNAQNKLEIPKEHCLPEADIELTNVILSVYKKDLVARYFQGNLSLIRSKHYVSGATYFIFTLYDFLRKHQGDYTYLGYDMHAKMVERKSLASSIGAGSETIYALTDFAVVYHKLYYITYMFCKNSKISNPDGDRFNNDQHIKEILDTKQLKILRY